MRSKNRDALNAQINAIMEQKTSAEWIDLLNAQGVACGAIYAIDEMFEDPQVKHLGIVTPMHTDNRGVLNVMRQPVSLSRTPSTIARQTPERGEHSEEMLAEFGFSARRDRGVARLRRDLRRRVTERKAKAMTQTDKMLSRKEGGIGYVIFNNPERHNAVSMEMWEATKTILDGYAKDDEVPRGGAHRRRRQGVRVGRRYLEIRRRARDAGRRSRSTTR